MSTRRIKITNISFYDEHETSDPFRTAMGALFPNPNMPEDHVGEGVRKFTTEIGEKIIDEGELYPKLRQKIKITGDSSFFHDGSLYDPNMQVWSSYVNQIVRQTSYYSINAEYNLPILDETLHFTDDSLFDSEFFYNYEFYDYEVLTNYVDERDLPSHILFDYKNYIEKENNYRPLVVENIVSFGGNFDFSEFTLTKVNKEIAANNISPYLFDVCADGSNPEDTIKEVKSFDDNLFKFYTKKRMIDVQSPDASQYDFSDYSRKNTHIFVLYDEYFPIETDYLPYYLKFNFPPLPSENDDLNIDENIISTRVHRFLFAHIKRDNPELINFNLEVGDDMHPDVPLATWDFKNWWTSTTTDELDELEDERFLTSKGDFYLESAVGFFERQIRKLIVLGSIRSESIDKLKNFYECVRDGAACSKSVLGYKIEKSLLEDGQPIQTFYLPARSGDGATLIDSQIAFDRRYYYHITMIAIVMGSKYSYTSLEIDNDNLTAEFEFVNEPVFKIIEIPLYTTVERAIEPPPLAPNVKVYHEMTKKNKINFILSDNQGNLVQEEELITGPSLPLGDFTTPHVEKMPYQLILDEDTSYLDKLSESSKGELQLYGFSSRASTQKFQIFKIDFKPTEYSDFAQGLIGTVAEEMLVDEKDTRGPALFVDYIAHEQKYYYLFRALTTHDNPSNPSFIYEVELLEDADEVILKWDSFQFYEDEVEKNFKKTFRKFLRMMPTQRHIACDNDQFAEDASAETDTLVLGELAPQHDTIWDFNDKKSKYIKLRLTSKQTGKKIDLNLTFNLKKVT